LYLLCRKCHCIFYGALQWSEDHAAERRILIDRNAAVSRFLNGEDGRIQLDELTVAFNKIKLVPREYKHYLSHKDSFLDEVNAANSRESQLLYLGHYTKDGTTHPIIILSQVDRIEFGTKEIIYSSILILSLIATLLLVFGTLLVRLSKQLIDPVNDISQQLSLHSGKLESKFSVSNHATEEFHVLTNCLNEYRIELRDAIRREKAFARYTSHELRTPLTIIKGANKLLTGTSLSEFQKRQTERIETSSSEMLSIINALLTIVRHEKYTASLPIRLIDRNEVRNIIQKNTYNANNKNIKLTLDFLESPRTTAPSMVIDIILSNLLRNSIAANCNGQVNIIVSQKYIDVIDDGPGLNNSDRMESEDSTGLGLLIVEDLCKRFNCDFKIKDHPIRGCSARITFKDRYYC